MSTLTEIKTAIERLTPHDRALLAAELFAMEITPDESKLREALERGLADVSANRLRPVESVNTMIPGWISKS
jgi:hypothetical protein